MKRSSSKTLVAITICLLIGGLVALVFGQSAWYGYNAMDDPAWISENPTVQRGLTGEGLRYAFEATIVGHRAPLTVLSHMAAWQGLGDNAGAHHLVNVALHATGAVLLFLALWSLTRGLWQSAAVAVFFAVHPLRVESVVWITERKDVLSGVFFFLALGAYGWWTRRRGLARYLVVVFLAAGGLLSKSMLVTLPCVLLLLDFWPLQRVNGIRDLAWRVAEKLPFFALAVGAAMLQYHSAEPVSLQELGWGVRLENAVVSYAIYAGQLVWPASLAVYYPHWGTPQPPPHLLAGVVSLLAITAVVARHGRTHRYLWVGWLWYLGMLVPVIGLVQSGDIARADRYTYLPQIGLLIMAAWGLAALVQGRKQRAVALASGCAVGLVAAVMTARTLVSTWKNEETLWTHALQVTKGNYRAYHSLGLAEAKLKNYAAAIPHLREAVKLNPTRPPHALGMALLGAGQIDEALEMAKISVEMNPGQTAMAFGIGFKGAGEFSAAAWCFQKALAARPGDDEAELELAFVLARLGATAESEQAYAAVLKRQPGRVEALAELGMLFLQEGRVDEAIPLLEEALGKAPDESKVLTALANARLMQGQSSLAVSLYRKALDQQPELAEAQANLAWQLATSVEDSLRNGKEAVQWAQRAVDGSHGTDPSILRILAAAHAEAGQYAEAVATIQRAITLGQQQGDSNLTARLEAQRDVYASDSPLRVPLRPPTSQRP